MEVRWQKLLLTVTFWLATEICFNFLGIDHLANYSEFISSQKLFYSATDSFFS
jgi:hypothetical protein